ncbi:hypothetical protein AB0D09_27125 [Streptomyces sp. NPDC049097]|uniref:hypothetical protein n=1 Tax=Streptomyces sp. NPDC049097 TaxID=3155497 RepID=UPI0034448B2D
MTRLSRDQKRGRSASGAVSEGGAETGTAPIEVRVPMAPGAETTVGGAPVSVRPGEEAQEVVLDHLHRRALATGRPVVATVHDERIGYVVAIRVYVDGSSEYAAEPVQMGTTGTADAPQAPRRDEPTYDRRPVDAEQPAPGASAPTFPLTAVREPSGPSAPHPPTGSGPVPPAGVAGVRSSGGGAGASVRGAASESTGSGPVPPAGVRSSGGGAGTSVRGAASESTGSGPVPPVGVRSSGGGAGMSVPGAGPESTGSRPVRPATSSSGSPSVPPPVPAMRPTRPTAPPVAPVAPAGTGASASTAPQPAQAPPAVVWASAPVSPDRPVPPPAVPSVPAPGPQPAPAAPATAQATGPVPPDRPASAPAASSVRSSSSAVRPPAAAPSSGQGPAPRPESREAGRDVAQGRPGGTVSTFVLRAVPEDAALISAESGPAQALPAGDADGGRPTSTGPEPAPAPQAPGTVSAPTGTFGPPPVIPAGPLAPSSSQATPAPTPLSRRATTGAPPPSAAAPPPAWPAAAPSSVETPEVLAPPATDADSEPDRYSAPDWKPTAPPKTVPVAEVEEEAKEPPVREFDSMAEAVLAPDSGAVPPDGAGGPIAEPMARINAAVKQGRIEEAAALAERTVAEASASLGDDHPDVLRLRELTAYIAYLATDVLRSFHLSLELARLRHRLGDSRGAYGNVQSAAAAWRAVRDPIQGLHLGRDLIAVWSELAASEGPAADDLDQLEQARNRMGRLADRARVAAGGEPPHPR